MLRVDDGYYASEFRSGLLKGHTGLESANYLQKSCVAIIPSAFVQSQRSPEFGTSRKIKTHRHYSNDRMRLATQCDRFTDDRGVRMEVILPKRIMQDDDWGGGRMIVGGREGAAQNGL